MLPSHLFFFSFSCRWSHFYFERSQKVSILVDIKNASASGWYKNYKCTFLSKFSPAWDSVKLILKVGFNCLFLVYRGGATTELFSRTFAWPSSNPILDAEYLPFYQWQNRGPRWDFSTLLPRADFWTRFWQFSFNSTLPFGHGKCWLFEFVTELNSLPQMLGNALRMIKYANVTECEVH